ncbi:hypothetical protein NPIL_421031 [Nephila pilipes]|uniref:Uncharacterized protein n=1 Tax=Nephila pilipes TaxID=299642 RepID=A0A8X6UGF7_NEPPI|nr:hypothetical protein NPIL_421031 [Nephila pilipes]
MHRGTEGKEVHEKAVGTNRSEERTPKKSRDLIPPFCSADNPPSSAYNTCTGARRAQLFLNPESTAAETPEMVLAFHLRYNL